MFPGARSALFLLFEPRPGKILAGILLLVLCGAIIYSLLQIVAALRYLAVRPPVLLSTEPISILKPLAGLDLDLESNLRTFFQQDYPAFEILFAGRHEADPAREARASPQAAISKSPTALVAPWRPAISQREGVQPRSHAGRREQRSG